MSRITKKKETEHEKETTTRLKENMLKSTTARQNYEYKLRIFSLRYVSRVNRARKREARVIHQSHVNVETLNRLRYVIRTVSTSR